MRSSVCCTTLALSGVLVIGVAMRPGNARADEPKPPPGFTALFNGKDLTGWQGNIDMKQRATLPKEKQEELIKKRTDIAREHWKVKDGVLALDGKGGVSLQTVKDYGNFELLVDWKIEKKGDSGIYLRGQPQVQIWDSDNLAPSLKADAGTGSGGLWNNPLPKGIDPRSIGKTPIKKADKPVGEWNTFRIIMKGDRVTVYLNGEMVVINQPLAPYKAFNDKLPEKGPIELQFHNDPIWFRNIYIKELP